MEVKLDKRYPLAVDAARAWQLLQDLKGVAGCMPGAEILEQLSPTQYKGAVKVKVGPASAQFGGTVEVLGVNEATQSLTLNGKGADKGGSSASMALDARIEADANDAAACVLCGNASVIVNGKFAQFGGRMMVQVSEMILVQFVQNFQAAALALPGPVTAPITAPVAATVTAPADVSPGSAATADAPLAASPAPAPAAPAAPAVPKELDGMAIFWALLKSWIGGIFGRKP